MKQKEKRKKILKDVNNREVSFITLLKSSHRWQLWDIVTVKFHTSTYMPKDPPESILCQHNQCLENNCIGTKCRKQSSLLTRYYGVCLLPVLLL